MGPDYSQTPCVHAFGMSSTSLPHSDAKAQLNKGGASSGNTGLPVSPASLPSSLCEGVHPLPVSCTPGRGCRTLEKYAGICPPAEDSDHGHIRMGQTQPSREGFLEAVTMTFKSEG